MNDTWEELAEQYWLDDNIQNVLLDKINILDILDKWGLTYSPCVSGDFEYRMKCPFPNHKSGDERTASLFISPKGNGFYCFGCNSGKTLIDFVSFYKGIPYYEAIKYLLSLLDTDNTNLDETLTINTAKNPEHRVFTHMFRAGIYIRDFIIEYKNSPKYKELCEWADKEFLELDNILDNLSDEDWEKAKAYCNKISNRIKEMR